MNSISDEQRAELRRLLAGGTPGPWEVMAYDSGLSYRELNVSVITEKHGDRIADCDYDTDRDGPQVAEGADAYLIVAAVNALPELLDEVDTLRNQLRDMAIERNMLRICVKELTDSLEAGDACGAVGCRAMGRLSEVIDEAADDLLVRATAAEERLAKVEALFTGGPDTPCRTTWREHPPYGCYDKTECVEVPLDALRAALSTERP